MAPDGGAPLVASIEIMHHSVYIDGGVSALLLKQYIDMNILPRFYARESTETFPGRDETTVKAVVETYYNLSNIASVHHRHEDGIPTETLVSWPDGFGARFEPAAGKRIADMLSGALRDRLEALPQVAAHYERTYGALFPLDPPESLNPPLPSAPYPGKPTLSVMGQSDSEPGQPL